MRQRTIVAEQRTRAMARVMGPFVTIVATIVALRLPRVTPMLTALFEDPALPWMLGAAMLLMGVVVVALHQFWYRPAAVAISLLGWFVGLRGLALMAFPSSIEAGGSAALAAPASTTAAQVFFLALAILGAWLTYVGWIERSTGAAG